VSIIPKEISNPSRPSVAEIKYQPRWPLHRDPHYGFYKPITTLEASIQADFEALLLTTPPDWPMNPELGVGLKKYLFENFSAMDTSDLQARIVDQANKHLPPVKILKVELSTNDSQTGQEIDNFLSLRIVYMILNDTVMDTTAWMDSSGEFTMDTYATHRESAAFRDRRSDLPSDETEI
jgi:hypothetical protein